MKRTTVVLLLLCPLFVEAASLPANAQAYVQEAGRAPAVAIARITPEGIERAVAGPASVSEDSLFEIGSITKVFTGILLADLVLSEIVTLETPIGDLIDDDRALDPEVATITLRELATHTSGLPRLPMNGRMLLRLLTQQSDPYRGLTTEDLFDDLAAMRGEQLVRRGQMQYSNFGMAVLGRLLERTTNDAYETLLRQRVLLPLGLEGMDFIDQRMDDPALIGGHRGNLRPTRHWHFAAYAPAGGMVGSLAQLEDFLVAAMTSEPGSPLRLSIEAELGWAHSEHDEGTMIWHNGQTGGFHAFAGFYRDTGHGVVVLSNAANSADEFAVGLLRGNSAPKRPDPGWIMLGFTVLFTPIGAVLLFAFMQQSASRLHGLDAMLASIFVLGLTWKLGTWTHIPLLYWYIAAIVTLVLAGLAVPRLATAPWAPVNRPLATIGKVISVLFYAALAAWVVVRL